ncbi:MAG: hypothetical protein FWF77_00645 [Defluviitaleaceae bacterium]|nr:hypothetical protein [Defluviitaleaceae bacterium]
MSNEEKILAIVTELQGDFKDFDKRLAKLEKGQAKLEKGQAKLEKGQTELQKDVKTIKADVHYLKLASNEAFRDISILDKQDSQMNAKIARLLP